MSRPAAGSPLPARRSERLPLILLCLVIAAYAAYFSWLTLARFYAFESRALDMGNLNQAIWNTAHGNWFHQTNQPGVTNRLSLHVEPILLPIAALYRLWPGPPFLLVLQAVVVAGGAIPLYALGRRQLGSSWLALLFAVAWLAMPAIQAANWLEFHPLTLAPTFLMAAFYFLLERRPGWYALFAVLAAACKEEIGLLIFMLGLYALLARRQRWTGLLTMVLGLGWSLFAVLGIQQAFGGNIHWGRYSYLGDTPAELLRTVLTQPGLVLDQLARANVSGYLYELLLPVGFLALLAPEVLLLALPSLAINLLADFPPMHEVDSLIYAAPIAPFVALAAVMGTGRLLRWLRAGEAGASPRRAAPWAIAALVLLALGIAQWQYGYLPGGANFRLHTVTPHHEVAQQIIAQIPSSAAVSAQDKINPHTSGRVTSYIFPRVLDDETGDADTAIVDVTGPSWPQHPNDVHASVQSLLGEGWGIVDAADGIVLLSSSEANQQMPPAFYSAWQKSPPEAPLLNQRARFGPLELKGIDVFDDAHGEVVVRTRWQAVEQHTTPLTIRLAYLGWDDAPLYDSVFSPPVIGLWYPTTEWALGAETTVSSLPWPLPDGRFTLLLSVHEGTDAAAGRVAVEEVAPARPLLEGGSVLRIGGFERTRRGWQLQPPPKAQPASLDARFGEALALEAAAIEPAARGVPTVTVTLQWRAGAVPARDDSIYIHVLDSSGAKVAQWDGPPRDSFGVLPMTAWAPGDPVIGSYAVPLVEDLPPGDYRLITGVYDWAAAAPVPAEGRDTHAGAAAIGTLVVR